MKTRWRFFLITICFMALNALACPGFASDIYHGRVVDEDTGEPLAGAVITVIWYRTPIIQMEGSLYFHSAQETLTDKEGRFSFEVGPGIDWSPFTYVRKEPNIIVYQPGYTPLSPYTTVDRGFRSFTELDEALKMGALIKLPKLKTKQDLTRVTGLSSLGTGQVPLEKIPNLVRLIDVQREMLGFKSFYRRTEKGNP